MSFLSKKLFLKSLFLLFIGIFTAEISHAGWIEDKDGKTIIHVKAWALPDAKSSAPNAVADYAVLKSFVAKFPSIFKKRYAEKYKVNPSKYGKYNWDNVAIELHAFSGISVEGMGMDSKPLMAIAGGVAPDILYVCFRLSDTYIQSGFLYPLDKPEDDYISSMTKEELDFCVHDKIWSVIKRKGPGEKMHVWAKPHGGVLGKVVFYRKDLLDEFGIEYPTNNWTWDDLMENCKKLTDPQKGTYGISIGKGMNESFYWMSFLWSAGGEAITFDKQKNQWKACFDSDAAVTALDFYTKLCNQPWQDKDGREHFGYAARENDYSKWSRGKIGFFFNNINEKLFSSINPEVTGMVAVPLGPDGKRGGEINSEMQGLFSKIKDIPVRDAAWEYLRYIDSKEAVEIRTRKMVEGGLGRFVNPKYLRMFGYDDIIRMAPKGWEETFKIAMDTGKPEPYGKNCQTVYYYMTYPIQDAASMEQYGTLSKNPEERKAQLKHLLENAVKLTNSKMLGQIPPGEMRWRRIVASVLLLIIALTFSYALSVIIKTFAPPKTEGVKSVKWGFFKYKTAYIILIPAVLSIFFWQYLPLLIGSKMAFQDYQILKPSIWIGVDNFANILWEPQWWTTVWNSFCYSFLVVSLTFMPPVILAVLLDEVPYGKIFFRTLFYLPAVITGLVVIYLWKSFYGKEHTDVLNSVVLSIPAIGYIILGLALFILFALFARRLCMQQVKIVSIICVIVGVALFIFTYTFAHNIIIKADAPWYAALFMKNINPYDWLGDRKTALLSCVLPMVWAGMGPGCLIYLAALKGIAPDFYEAADIDGATFLDKILFIVIPSLKALLIINFIGVFVASWKSSAYILAMTGIDPKTKVVGLKIFEDAYMFLQFGPAAAEAWMLGFMLIGFTIYQLRILSRLEFKTTGGDKK